MKRAAAQGKDSAAGTDVGAVGGSQPVAPQDQAERQGFDRQRLDPQDQPPAKVRDRGNLAGEKDFELGPGGKP